MDSEFPRKLREFRRKNAITQKGLASLIGVDYVTINRWENGRGKPQQAKLDVLEGLMKNGLPLSASKPTRDQLNRANALGLSARELELTLEFDHVRNEYERVGQKVGAYFEGMIDAALTRGDFAEAETIIKKMPQDLIHTVFMMDKVREARKKKS